MYAYNKLLTRVIPILYTPIYLLQIYIPNLIYKFCDVIHSELHINGMFAIAAAKILQIQYRFSATTTTEKRHISLYSIQQYTH